jgi:hypothetical protein
MAADTPRPPRSLRSGNLAPRGCRQRAPARAGRAACAAIVGYRSSECLQHRVTAGAFLLELLNNACEFFDGRDCSKDVKSAQKSLNVVNLKRLEEGEPNRTASPLRMRL